MAMMSILKRVSKKAVFFILTTLGLLLSACGGDGDDSGGSGSNSSNSSSSSNTTRLERPSNVSCLAGDKPSNTYGIELTRAYPNLSFRQPIAIKQAPNNNSTWYVVQQNGEIFQFANDASTANATSALDLTSIVDTSADESGLLAIAFDPNFASNQKIYAFFQTRQNNQRRSVLASFTHFDISTRQDFITLTPPFSNHFGGEIAFGPDGYLYLTIGDGGSGGDPGNRAQNNTNLFGTILRLDVSNSNNGRYSIPSDNPFAGNALCNTGESSQNANCPEIYAWGLRNSWRFSFDEPTGNLWLADVGQDAYEEVNIIQRGGNYGWRIKEATRCFNPRNNCDSSGLIDPVAEIAHPNGESITGGRVYRGSDIPGLIGNYIFADYRTGNFWALISNEDGGYTPENILQSGYNIGHFGNDQAGELYVVDYGSGQIFKLSPAQQKGISAPPTLSKTGCVESNNPTQFMSGVIPYDLKATFWSDGAQKNRFFAIPDNTQIDTSVTPWVWPAGSVIIKEFFWDNKRIETRLMKRHNDSSWAGYSYAWNENQTEARLVQGGKVGAFNNNQWIYPTEVQCLQCHTQVTGRALGLTAAQLNTPVDFEGLTNTPQLDIFNQLQVISHEVLNPPTLADPTNQTLSITERARAYLDTNCAQCHQENGPTNVDLDLRYNISLNDMNICGVEAQSNEIGLANPMRLVPGDIENSMLYQRMNRRDLYQMPPIGSYVVDQEGAELIKAWIEALNGC